MINYHKEVVSALSKVLPTHYEMALTSKTKTPCYSYMELNNYSSTEVIGATLGYNVISFQIKVWSDKVSELQQYALEADKAMRAIGFKRISSGELPDPNSAMVQKILTYEAIAYEKFN